MCFVVMVACTGKKLRCKYITKLTRHGGRKAWFDKENCWILLH